MSTFARTALIALSLPVLLVGCISGKRIERATSQVDLGTAYYREGNTEAAVDALRRATELDPRNWRAWNALAVSYIAKGEDGLAGEAFARALRIDGEEGEILVNYGAWLVTQNRGADAVTALESATHDLDYRNQAMVLSNLALAYLAADRPEDALKTAREAVRRAPTLCQGWFHVGLAEEARADVPAAIEAYETIIQRCPAEATGAWLRVGCLEVSGSDPDAGVSALQHVLSSVPGTPLADQARTCMAQASR